MLSITVIRKMLGLGEQFSDEDVKKLRDMLYNLANIFYQDYKRGRQ